MEGKSLAALVAGFFLFFFLSILIGTLGDRRLFPFPAEQPIRFNHRKHVQEHELECYSCHEFYEKETFSGLPGAELCSFCHLEALGESPEEQRLVKLLEEGAPLEWRPLFRQPPHVFYSHRRHVLVAGIDCSVCHGRIAESEEPPERVRQLRMEDCQECHRRKGASVECTACHR